MTTATDTATIEQDPIARFSATAIETVRTMALGRYLVQLQTCGDFILPRDRRPFGVTTSAGGCANEVPERYVRHVRHQRPARAWIAVGRRVSGAPASACPGEASHDAYAPPGRSRNGSGGN
jgi:hypothetical protein